MRGALQVERLDRDIRGEDLLDQAVLESPNLFYARLAQHAPVWRAGDSEVYLVSSHSAVSEACARVEDFSSNLVCMLYKDENGLPARLMRGFGEGGDSQILATADPPHHAAHKKLISPEFSPKRIAALECQVATMTVDRLAPGLAGGGIEFMTGLANLIPIDVVGEMIGFSERNTKALFDAAIVQTDILASAISRQELEARLNISSETFGWVFMQLQQAIAQPGSGILGLLARAINQGKADIPLAMTVLLTLFAAGGESTSSLIGNATHILAQDIELQQRLRSDPGLIPKFAEEVLRIESPFRYHMRVVKRDSQLCGVALPAGATLLLMWGAANRDPAAFDRPEIVDLDRPRRHVAFGSGVHVCLGNTLARLEARVVLEGLLAATRSFVLDDGDPPRWVPSLAVRRLDHLPLVLEAA